MRRVRDRIMQPKSTGSAARIVTLVTAALFSIVTLAFYAWSFWTPVPFDPARWPQSRTNDPMRHRMADDLMAVAQRERWTLPQAIEKLGPPDEPQWDVLRDWRRGEAVRLRYITRHTVISLNHSTFNWTFDGEGRLERVTLNPE